MDLSTLTLEELQSARPDLLESVTEQQETSHELEQLKAKVEEFEAKEAKAKLEGEIRSELEAAGLDHADEKQVSKVFFEQLVACEKAESRKSLIDDRKSLVGDVPAPKKSGATESVNPPGEKPRTTPVTEGAGGGNWLKRLRSRR